jgi:hypothetical protein
VVKQRDCPYATPRLGFASELNTGLPINHDVAAPRVVKISVAFQNALMEMGLIRFVVREDAAISQKALQLSKSTMRRGSLCLSPTD